MRAYKSNTRRPVWKGIGLSEFAACRPLGVQGTLRGTGWAYGATAGVTLTPTPTTTIGLGWRSALNQKIDGMLVTNVSLPGTTVGSVDTTVDLPDIVSLGIRQRVDPRWTLLGTVEWSNWSRIGTSNILQLNGSPATISRSRHLQFHSSIVTAGSSRAAPNIFGTTG